MVEEELTDEQLASLFAQDGEQVVERYVDEVEKVRSGYLLARDPKAYRRWRRDVDRKTRRPVGKDLAQLAQAFGGTAGMVVRGEFEFRN